MDKNGSLPKMRLLRDRCRTTGATRLHEQIVTHSQHAKCYQKNRGFVSKKTAVWRTQSLSPQVVNCFPVTILSSFTFPEIRTTLNARDPRRGPITL